MAVRFEQVKNLERPEDFLGALDALGIQIPFTPDPTPVRALASPTTIRDAAAGVLTTPNRFVALPMEGWDGDDDGRPTDLVRRRWTNFATSECGLVWGEATAVRADGRANPNQLTLVPENVDDIATLRSLLDPAQVAGLQLTHSGRYSKPHGEQAPRTAYEHPLLDARTGAGPSSVLSDGELDELVDAYVAAACRARDAGFDFVDVKHCHGYLLHELLSATTRPGPYGGSFAGRTHFLRQVVEGIRDRAPGLAIAVRLSAFDFRPFEPGEGGIGRPEGDGPYPYAFGGDGSGSGIDLTEAHELLDLLEELGVGLVSVTAGSPYTTPHIQRPAYFPPSDGYLPPEDPLVGVARQLAATAALTARHPSIAFVGSGYSYLQDWLPHVAEAVVATGGATLVGLGRMMLSYPHLAADVLADRPIRRRLVCRTFSDCTTAPRNGLVSGCYPLDPFYKAHPQRVALTKAKRAAKARMADDPTEQEPN